MLKKFMTEKHFVGIDIGSQGLKAGMIRLDEDNQPQLLGVYEVKTSDFRKGSVSDIDELTLCRLRHTHGHHQDQHQNLGAMRPDPVRQAFHKPKNLRHGVFPLLTS